MGSKTVTLIVTAIFALGTLSIQPLAAETSSESERLEKLERAVRLLQERNAELEQEVRSFNQASKLQAVRSSADGRTNGVNEPSALTLRLSACEMFVPAASRLLRASPPSFKLAS